MTRVPSIRLLIEPGLLPILSIIVFLPNSSSKRGAMKAPLSSPSLAACSADCPAKLLILRVRFGLKTRASELRNPFWPRFPRVFTCILLKRRSNRVSRLLTCVRDLSHQSINEFVNAFILCYGDIKSMCGELPEWLLVALLMIKLHLSPFSTRQCQTPRSHHSQRDGTNVR